MKRFVIAATISVTVFGSAYMAGVSIGARSAGATPAPAVAAAAPTPPTVRIGGGFQVGQGAVNVAGGTGVDTNDSRSTVGRSVTSGNGVLEQPWFFVVALLGAGLIAASGYRVLRRNPFPLPAVPELILVVDDEPAFRRSVARMLSESGYDVREAEDGVAALHAIDCGLRPSLVLTDVAMSGVSGTDLSSRLEEQGLFNTVLMSGRDLAEHSTRFIRKPFQEGELLTMVRRELAPVSASASSATG